MPLKSIFVAGISWKITQVKQKLTWPTFVRSEEDNPLGSLPTNISLHDHPPWGLSKHLLLLGRIFVTKWGLRPNIKVQAFVLIVVIFPLPMWLNSHCWDANQDNVAQKSLQNLITIQWTLILQIGHNYYGNVNSNAGKFRYTFISSSREIEPDLSIGSPHLQSGDKISSIFQCLWEFWRKETTTKLCLT